MFGVGTRPDAICNDSDLECDLMSDVCFTGELSVRGRARADLTTFAPCAFTVVLERPTLRTRFACLCRRTGSLML